MIEVYADGNSIFNPLKDDLITWGQKLSYNIGKAGSFEFMIAPKHRFYKDIKQMRTRVNVFLDGEEIFRGRVLSNDKNFENIKNVYCEGDLSYLMDSVQRSDKYDGTVHDLFSKFISKHNAMVDEDKRFAVGKIDIPNKYIHLSGASDETEDPDTGKIDYNQIHINAIVDEWKTTMELIQTCIIDQCGGFLKTRRDGNTIYIDIMGEDTSVSLQKIRFGENLLDLNESISADDLFTVLIPIGDEHLTIESVNGGSVELVNQDEVKKYGRIVKTYVFPNVNQASTLLENGLEYMKKHSGMPTSITARAIDMHFVDGSNGRIKIGDKVHIQSFPHEISGYLTCTAMTYDFDNPSRNEYTFGFPPRPLTERYRKDKQKQENREKYPETSMRSGGGGGGAIDEEEDFTLDKVEKKFEEFEEQYIGRGPNNDMVKLYDIYKRMMADREILKTEVGIDLDAGKDPITGEPRAKFNIRSMYEEVVKNEKTNKEFRQKSISKIESVNNKQQALQRFTTSLANETSEKLAEITMNVGQVGDELRSSITMHADQIAIHANEILNLNTKQLKTTAEQVQMKNALLEVKKIATESIQSKLAQIDTVNVKNLLSFGNVYAKRMILNGESVATQAWVMNWTNRFATKDDLKNYALKNHTHSHRHSHIIYINGKRYETGYTTP